jgi:hypothetical protein
MFVLRSEVLLFEAQYQDLPENLTSLVFNGLKWNVRYMEPDAPAKVSQAITDCCRLDREC